MIFSYNRTKFGKLVFATNIKEARELIGSNDIERTHDLGYLQFVITAGWDMDFPISNTALRELESIVKEWDKIERDPAEKGNAVYFKRNVKLSDGKIIEQFVTAYSTDKADSFFFKEEEFSTLEEATKRKAEYFKEVRLFNRKYNKFIK